ncbi:MAG: CBS domain-containing protein [Gemmatimonadetes bacterium]|nr:CBS domain-containing protein [Gemmatimonadota bacterium]MYE92110.1 CBS domain-containing protein [Gemmatimonadota bacterium]MYJ11377.1 CBS domain-containing protein [Gemmatimonadota bacterium]
MDVRSPGFGELLCEPRIMVGSGGDAWDSLRRGVHDLAEGHVLRDVCRRVERAGGKPEPMPLVSNVDVLNLSRSDESPGVVLWLSERTEERLFGRAAWAVWGLPRPSLNLFLLPVLTSLTDAVLAADSVDTVHAILSSKSLVNKRIDIDVRVESVVTPLTYRIYPDTPLREVQHLLVRRDLSTVPVVGANHEILGVITVTDILPHMLPSKETPGTRARRPVAARDVMTRAVLCVSEDELLVEAGRSMVARGVSRLPVVRYAELVGFLERETVMRAFADSILPPRRPRAG